MKRLFLLALVALASVQALDAQVFTLGADPVGIKWKSEPANDLTIERKRSFGESSAIR